MNEESVLPEKVLKYRKKHKKCIYCMHCTASSLLEHDSYYWCHAKAKIIKNGFPDMSVFPRLFCPCYEPSKRDKFYKREVERNGEIT